MLTEHDKRTLKFLAAKPIRTGMAVLVPTLVVCLLVLGSLGFYAASRCASEIDTSLSDTVSTWWTGFGYESNYLGAHVMSVVVFDKAVYAMLFAALFALGGLVYWRVSNVARRMLASVTGVAPETQPPDGSDAATTSEGDGRETE